MTRCGYMAVFFCFGIKDKKRVSVHRVVASAFLDADSHRAHINHKNGNKADNRAENLEWVTPSENALHAIQLGLYRPNRMMTPEQKRKAISMRAAGLSFKQISESIGCSISTARSATLQAPEKQSHHLPADVELRDVERT